MTSLAVASLFSGVGGIDLGFHAAGIPTRLLCEYDKHAASVLTRRFPGVPIHPDVQELTADDLAAAGLVPERTILAGGFPCQDLSVAGARRGMGEGTRSGLYWHIDRLLGEFRPAWVVLENVPGLLSSNGGRDMGAVLGSLADRGYGFAYRVLDAQFFGVPQRRRRVVIVGRLGDSGAAPAQVLLEPEGGGWNPPAGFPQGPGTARNSARRTGGAGREIATTLTAREGKGPDSYATTTLIVNSLTAANGGADDNMAQANHLVPVIAPTLQAGGNETGGTRPPGTTVDTTESLIPVTFQKVTRPASPDHPDVWERRDVAATLSPFDLGSETRAVDVVVQPLAIRGRDEGAQLEVAPEGSPAHSVRTPGGGSSHPMVAVTTLGDRTHTLTAEGHDASEDGTGRGTPVVAFHLTQDPISGDVSPAMGAKSTGMGVHTETTVRRLTPLECERLQGHPDNWTEGQADSHRYKQMGNGVAVPVFAWVAKRLAAVHEAGAA